MRIYRGVEVWMSPLLRKITPTSPKFCPHFSEILIDKFFGEVGIIFNCVEIQRLAC